MNEIERAIKDFEEFKQAGYTHNELPSSWHIELAISALREKQKRDKGCEYCNNTDYIFESQQKIETPQWDEYEDGFIVIRQHINFCPMCGKQLEDKHEQ